MIHLGRTGQNHRDREAEISAEHVVSIGASNIGHLNRPLKDDLVVESMEDELKEGHDDELRGLDLADDGAEGDEHGGDAKESVHQRVDVQVNIMPVVLGGEVVVVVHLVEEGLAEGVPLQGDGREQHGEAHGAQAVSLHEGHEVAEANEPVLCTDREEASDSGSGGFGRLAGSHHDLHPSEVEIALSDGAGRVLIQKLDLTTSSEDDQESWEDAPRRWARTSYGTQWGNLKTWCDPSTERGRVWTAPQLSLTVSLLWTKAAGIRPPTAHPVPVPVWVTRRCCCQPQAAWAVPRSQLQDRCATAS
eukprot:scaffold14705_cov249-Ochromonas_danica.AAC.3